MSTDIRVHTGLPTNHKTKKLIRSCGTEGFYSLMCLWCWVAVNRTNGDLTNMDIEDIEISSEWTGAEGLFVSECVRIGFIDRAEDCLKLHDWKKIQVWVIGSEDRSNAARLKKLSQVNRRKYDSLMAEGVTGLTAEDYIEATKVKTVTDNLPTASQQLANSKAKVPFGSAPYLSLPILSDPILTLPIQKNNIEDTESKDSSAIIKKQKLTKKESQQKEVLSFIESLKISERLKEAIVEFSEHKIEIKNGLTLLAVKKLFNALNKKFSSDDERIEAIDTAIEKGWKGIVYPEDKKSFNSNGFNNIPKDNRVSPADIFLKAIAEGRFSEDE